MFRWMLMVKKLFPSTHVQEITKRRKARRLKVTVKPCLEALEDRTLLSGSTLPVMAVASPQAASSDTAVMSYVSSMIQQRVQLFAAIEQFAVSEYQVISQEIAQEASVVEQQWDHLLGINPTPPNPTPSAAVTQPSSDSGAGRGNSSGSGSGTGAMTSGHNAANQALHNTKQQSGSGSGSGSSASTAHAQAALHGSTKVQPMDGGTGSPGSGVSGSGTGSVGGHGSYGTGYVSGKVWLDNNGNGIQDNTPSYQELGYYGATVDLFAVQTGSPPVLVASTTSGSDGTYSMQVTGLGPVPEPFLVHVVFPNYMTDTFPTADNMLNNKGNSSIFDLAAGGWRMIKAGLLSMNVTTTQDDPNAPIPNEITLRDAILTGNNGGGPWDLRVVTFISGGQPLSGTIKLGDNLPAIVKSFDITGPGASTLAVSGNNEWSLFDLEANSTSTISGLTIKNGSSGVGGGAEVESGYLTLSNDTITGNKATSGGGVYAALGSTLLIKNSIITANTSTADGGGIANYGVLLIVGSQITYNIAQRNGGGIMDHGEDMEITDSSIKNNTAIKGGGIYDSGSSGIMSSDTIQNNNANSLGGGIYLGGGALTLNTYTQINQNTANQGGGIFSVDGTLTLKGSNTQINQNTANQGGGIYQSGGSVKMTDGSIFNNKATADLGASKGGGGIYDTGEGSLALTRVDVTYNKAPNGSGGGLYMGTGQAQVTISGGSFQFNTVYYYGGGLYTSGGTLTLKGGAYFGPENSATDGGAMYLQVGSFTTFAGVTVQGNVATYGVGIFRALNARINPQNPGPPDLYDYDDPGGVPYGS